MSVEPLFRGEDALSTTAPWTSEQVAALNRYQTEGWMHPFTCGNPARTHDNHPHGGNLVATEKGWVCEDCDYTQDWAHPFMFLPCPWPRFGHVEPAGDVG